MAEHNLIQNPDIIGRLAKLLGMRQAHVAPTLNEGIQAVVIVDDARGAIGPASTPAPLRRTFVCAGWFSLGATIDGAIQVVNTQTCVLRLKRLILRTDLTTPVRLRMGIRDAPQGGALLGSNGFPNRSQNAIIQAAFVNPSVTSGPTNTNFISQNLGEYYISASQPLDIWDEYDVVLTPGTGWLIQTFGAAVNSNLAMTSVWETQEQ